MSFPKITITASRKFNHPYEVYSNLGSSITMEYHMVEGEKLEDLIDDLHLTVETVAERHKQDVLQQLHDQHRRETLQNRIDEMRSDDWVLRQIQHNNIAVDPALTESERNYSQKCADKMAAAVATIPELEAAIEALPDPIIFERAAKAHTDD